MWESVQVFPDVGFSILVVVPPLKNHPPLKDQNSILVSLRLKKKKEIARTCNGKILKVHLKV